jgi:hypothetical protein
MKHLDIIRLAFGKITGGKKFILLFFLATYVFVLFTSLYPLNSSKVFAANKGLPFCKSWVLGNSGQTASDEQIQKVPNYKDCKKGYDGGYANPNNADASHICTSSVANVGACSDGYKQGRKDKQAESGPAPSNNEIKAAAEKLCKSYQDLVKTRPRR